MLTHVLTTIIMSPLNICVCGVCVCVCVCVILMYVHLYSLLSGPKITQHIYTYINALYLTIIPKCFNASASSSGSLNFVLTKVNKTIKIINPFNAELNRICHLMALLGAHHIFHVNGLRVNITTGRHPTSIQEIPT